MYDVASKTPLELANNLSARLGNRVLLKREDLQPVFSFKLRGAYNKLATLSQATLDSGIICSSAGNHAQGVALAAKRKGIRAVVVMPVTTPSIKVEAVRTLGGEVVLHGDAYDDAYTHARILEKEQGLTFIHPFDDPDVIAGQGTIGMEILDQTDDKISAVFVPIGGGGLISGIAAYIKGDKKEKKKSGKDEKAKKAEPSAAAKKKAGIRRAALAKTHLAKSKGPIQAVVFTDTDMLRDEFWIRVQNLLGQTIAIPVSDNMNLVTNAIDNLTGSDELIGLRSRGVSVRPFNADRFHVDGQRRRARLQGGQRAHIHAHHRHLRAIHAARRRRSQGPARLRHHR